MILYPLGVERGRVYLAGTGPALYRSESGGTAAQLAPSLTVSYMRISEARPRLPLRGERYSRSALNASGSAAPVVRVTAMPKPKDFRVIPGGKPSKASPAEPVSADVARLLDRARRHRAMLPDPASDQIRSLLADFEDAVEALRRLELSAEAGARARAAEYRRLIAELDAEIVAVWQVGDPL